jgi:hypothetical protein
MAEAKQVDFLINGVRNPLTDEPLAGGKVYTYEAGTTTPSNLYIDRDTLEGEATNPVILDAYGRAEVFGNGVYKFVITDEDDVTVVEVDNLEYFAVISDTAIPALTSNLDFNGYRGVDLAPGTEAGDTVEYNQFVNAIDAVEADVSALETAVATQKFTDLTDTPSTLVGQATKIPRVNAGGTALEFYTPAQLLATGAFLNLSDTPAAFTGQQGKAPVVNAGANALEFGFPDARTLYGIAISASTPSNGQVLAYDSTLDVYKPVTPSVAPSLATLTPGTGITGDPYDGTTARTWTVATGGVTLAEAAGSSYTAPAGKTILAAAAISTAGVTSTLILPSALINAGILNVLIYVDYQFRVYHTYTYTVGAANSISVAPSAGGNDITRVMVLLGDA